MAPPSITSFIEVLKTPAGLAGNLHTIRDDALLLLTASIWGFAFVAQRAGMEFIGPFLFNGVRFALGSIALLPLICIRQRRMGRRRVEQAGPASIVAPRAAGPAGLFTTGLLLGAVLFLGASLQQIGIIYTTAGKAGFITGLYVILVPISGLLWGQRAGWGRWAGAALAVAGLYLLSVTGSFSIARGDFLVLLSALFWTAHVQLLARYSPRVDPIRLACAQFAVCSVSSLIAAFFTEKVHTPAIVAAAVPILYGGLFSVGIAYTLQVVVQKTAHPAHASIILSMEGVFAVLGGWLLLGEWLSVRGFVGCGLMLAGMIFSQASLLGNPSLGEAQWDHRRGDG
ncbi:MAG TPA: DMT family transporter [Spirochaetia bacterium]|nr:DMT family transporter [Spirochaetia bacterium]